VELTVSELVVDPLAEAQQLYPKSFGIMSREEADELARIIDEEFGKVNPDEWR